VQFDRPVLDPGVEFDLRDLPEFVEGRAPQGGGDERDGPGHDADVSFAAVKEGIDG
jgi:hypothetical protein